MRNIHLAVVLLALCPLLAAQQALDNDAIVKLAKAGLSDDLIVTTINASPGNYDTSANGLIALKTGGVSDKVVGAIVLKVTGSAQKAAPAAGSAPAPAAASAEVLPPGIDDTGVYLKDKSGAWVPMLPEIVNYASSDRIRNIASAGIVKSDLYGRIDGIRSRLNTAFPVTFAVYLPEGAAITDYQLLRLRSGPEGREFLSELGGFLHTSAAAARDTIIFHPEKIGPRLYRVVLQSTAGTGEYGLLAPSATGSPKKETTGKIYTVSVTD